MDAVVSFTILGIYTGAAYAIAASGLVLTYTTTRIFNLAHGAFGMLLAFTFWDLTQRQGMPTVVGLVLVLGVIAPAIGWAIHRFVARDLGEAPVSVSLVVTVGLFVGLIGLAQFIWPPEARTLPPFLPESGFTVGDTYVTAHQAITILASIAVALALYVLLDRTRVGTAMRAAVDNPMLLELFGGRPDRVAALSWAIGMSLAALAGILLTPVVGLNYYDLTLLVINAYAAAMVGRLTSLPLTFAGAMGLGIVQSFVVAYLPNEGVMSGVRAVVPALFLFVLVVAMPQAQLRIGQVRGVVTAPQPSWRRAGACGAGLVLAVALLAAGASDVRLLQIGTAATYAMVMLSLVLLTGFGGHVSLAQLTFAGVGALAYIKLDQPNLVGLVLAAVIAGAVGAIAALPVLRLTGLYLALATLAFGVAMDKLVFQADAAFGLNGVLQAERLSVLGVALDSLTVYVIAMTAFFVLTAFGVLALRRGSLGRILLALRDSPVACGTLGLDARWFRVGLFGFSAAIAGLAGALYAGLRGDVGAAEFQYFNSLPLLLLAVVCGVTSVTGAAIGGVALMLLPVLQSDHPTIAGLIVAVIGFAAVALGRDPNGLANRLFVLGRWALTTTRARVSLPILPGARPEVGAETEADSDRSDELEASHALA